MPRKESVILVHDETESVLDISNPGVPHALQPAFRALVGKSLCARGGAGTRRTMCLCRVHVCRGVQEASQLTGRGMTARSKRLLSILYD